MSTSTDAVLTATADAARDSIKLLIDFTQVAVPSAPTANLVVNPSDEVVTGMIAETRTSVVRSTAQARFGTASTLLTCTTAGVIAANTGVGVNGTPVSPSTSYSMWISVRAGTVGRVTTPSIDWYTSAGAFISTSAGAATASITAWQDRTWTATSPANAAFGTLRVSIAAAALNETHYVDARQIERGPATAYCDGSLPGCRWTGAAHNSVSYRPDYRTVTVTRSDGTVVAGLDGATAPGGMAKGYDNEAPRGVTVTYTATITNGIRTVSSTSAAAVIAANNLSWLKSRRFPALDVSLDLQGPPTWASPSNTVLSFPLNGVYPLAQAGPRRAPTSTMTLNIVDRATLNALEALISSGEAAYLLQLDINSGEPDRWVAITTYSVAPVVNLATSVDRTVTLGLAVVNRPPTAGSAVAMPGKTYADSAVAFPLYSNRTGTYGSRTA
jgi:hypothetical protein